MQDSGGDQVELLKLDFLAYLSDEDADFLPQLDDGSSSDDEASVASSTAAGTSALSPFRPRETRTRRNLMDFEMDELTGELPDLGLDRDDEHLEYDKFLRGLRFAESPSRPVRAFATSSSPHARHPPRSPMQLASPDRDRRAPCRPPTSPNPSSSESDDDSAYAPDEDDEDEDDVVALHDEEDDEDDMFSLVEDEEDVEAALFDDGRPTAATTNRLEERAFDPTRIRDLYAMCSRTVHQLVLTTLLSASAKDLERFKQCVRIAKRTSARAVEAKAILAAHSAQFPGIRSLNSAYTHPAFGALAEFVKRLDEVENASQETKRNDQARFDADRLEFDKRVKDIRNSARRKRKRTENKDPLLAHHQVFGVFRDVYRQFIEDSGYVPADVVVVPRPLRSKTHASADGRKYTEEEDFLILLGAIRTGAYKNQTSTRPIVSISSDFMPHRTPKSVYLRIKNLRDKNKSTTRSATSQALVRLFEARSLGRRRAFRPVEDEMLERFVFESSPEMLNEDETSSRLLPHRDDFSLRERYQLLVSAYKELDPKRRKMFDETSSTPMSSAYWRDGRSSPSISREFVTIQLE